MGASGVGMIAFGALAIGTGSAFTGGNFWEGALIVGIVAGLNHSLHKIIAPSNAYGNGEDPPGKSKKVTKDVKFGAEVGKKNRRFSGIHRCNG